MKLAWHCCTGYHCQGLQVIICKVWLGCISAKALSNKSNENTLVQDCWKAAVLQDPERGHKLGGTPCLVQADGILFEGRGRITMAEGSCDVNVVTSSIIFTRFSYPTVALWGLDSPCETSELSLPGYRSRGTWATHGGGRWPRGQWFLWCESVPPRCLPRWLQEIWTFAVSPRPSRWVKKKISGSVGSWRMPRCRFEANAETAEELLA